MVISLVSLYFILLFTSNVPLTLGATVARDWNAGDVIIFGTYKKSVIVTTNKEEGMKGEKNTEEKYENQYTIINIDEDSKIALINCSSSHGNYGTYNFNFDGMDMAQSLLTSVNFFEVHYFYNDATNRVLLSSINFYTSFWKLIEVDWGEFNNHFKGVFNDTNVISTLDTPSGTIETTVSEFLDSISYKICGFRDIENAREYFTATTTKWIMSFDLSGVAYFYDHEQVAYAPYKKYKVAIQIEYTPGGTLKNYQYTHEYIIETETRKIDYYYERIITLGGVNIIPIHTGFIAVCFSVVALAIIRVRKKNGK